MYQQDRLLELALFAVLVAFVLAVGVQHGLPPSAIVSIIGTIGRMFAPQALQGGRRPRRSGYSGRR